MDKLKSTTATVEISIGGSGTCEAKAHVQETKEIKVVNSKKSESKAKAPASGPLASASESDFKTAVAGFFVMRDVLSEEEEVALVEAIDGESWTKNRAGTRRVQIYGPVHDLKYKIHRNGPITEMPKFCPKLIEKVKAASLLSRECTKLGVASERSKLGERGMTEVFVNEYFAGARLDFHTDHRSTYEEVICGVSLLSDCYLSFKVDSGGKLQRVLLPRRSVYFMTGPSRFEFVHGLLPGDVEGDRRVSVTFRTVNASKIVD